MRILWQLSAVNAAHLNPCHSTAPAHFPPPSGFSLSYSSYYGHVKMFDTVRTRPRQTESETIKLMPDEEQEA